MGWRDQADIDKRHDAAAAVGMTLAAWAVERPDAVAVYDPDGKAHTFRQINASANQLARLLRQRGLNTGDAVALICSNRCEFIEALAATRRAGLRLTPINWHLTAQEIAYIVEDCDAKAVIAESRTPAVRSALAMLNGLAAKLVIGEPNPDCEDYRTTLAAFDSEDIDEPVVGGVMLYTSGTTGRPKGVLHEGYDSWSPRSAFTPLGYSPEASVQMCAGPAYHAAPLHYDVSAALAVGCPLVFLDKWDSETVLATIASFHVTHMHMVPIMFQRLLELPEAVRATYDVSSLAYIVHGAAPCPPEVKIAMIEWFGPIIHEYYASSEGGYFTIDSQEWLTRPGSVGKRATPLSAKALDEYGAECPRNVPGTIYHQLPENGGFTYYKDQEKTDASRVGGYFTQGDIGYFDEEDYLFLTGRSAEVIISGGVNIYPQEIDNELAKHPAVADSATIGVPHDEWGEQVKAVILLRSGVTPSEQLADDILGYARRILPSFKTPRSLDFVTDLPRSEAGKIQRNKVRASYWEGRSKQI
ncbi:MAG: AMP-binding protein [Phenylobacterium sp.]|nr:AMP-binding protein [Phenylobacterium sp.]